jgi:hypothetical protein
LENSGDHHGVDDEPDDETYHASIFCRYTHTDSSLRLNGIKNHRTRDLILAAEVQRAIFPQMVVAKNHSKNSSQRWMRISMRTIMPRGMFE